jgi:hypothetical protein
MRDSCAFRILRRASLLAAATTIAGALISAPADSQNLIPDPTFLYGTVAGWQPFAPTNTVLSWNPDSRHAGSGSLLITPPSQFGGMASQCVPAVAGRAYSWRGSGRGVGIFADVSFYSGTGCSGAIIGGRLFPPFIFPSTQWWDLEFISSSLPAVAPASTLSAKLSMGAASVPLKVDNLYFGPPGAPVLPVDVPALSIASTAILAACLGLAGVGALRAVGRC